MSRFEKWYLKLIHLLSLSLNHLKRFFVYKKINLLIILPLIIISFQNCSSKNQFGILSDSLNLKSNQSSNNNSDTNNNNIDSGGNGGGYEGKMDGVYVRWIPNFECQKENSDFKSVLVIENNTYTLTETNSKNCQNQTQQIMEQDLDIKLQDSNLIGIKDGLYQKIESDPNAKTDIQSLPGKSLTEAWCQSDESDNLSIYSSLIFKIESQITSVEKDETSNYTQPQFANRRLVIFDPISKKSQTIENIQHQHFLQKLTYFSSPFSLNIDATQLADFEKGLYPSKIKWLQENKEIEIKANCRLALNYDGLIWPSVQLTEKAFNTDHIINDQDTVLVGYSDGEIAKFDLSNYPEKKIVKNNLSKLNSDLTVSNIKVTNSSYLLQTESKTDGHYDLWNLDINNKLLTLINKPSTTTYDYNYDESSGLVVFLEGEMKEKFQSYESDFKLRLNNLNGDNYQIINAQTNGLHRHLMNLYWNPNSNSSLDSFQKPRWLTKYIQFGDKSIYRINSDLNDLHSAFAQSLFMRMMLSSDLKTLKNPIFSDDYLKYGYPFQRPLSEAAQISYQTLYQAQSVTQISNDIDAKVLYNVSNTNGINTYNFTHTLKNSITGVEISLLNIKNLIFSEDKKKILILHQLTNSSDLGTDKGSAINTESNLNSNLVLTIINSDLTVSQNINSNENIIDDKINFGFIDNNTIYFSSYTDSQKNSLYLTKVKINSLPNNQGTWNTIKEEIKRIQFQPSARNIKYSKLANAFLYLEDKNKDGESELYAYYHNLNSMDDLTPEFFKGVFQVNNRYSDYGGVYDYEFIKNKVIFKTKNKKYENYIFVWSLK